MKKYVFNTSFKPCYKWNTFNTSIRVLSTTHWIGEVLNLVINGIPSIRYSKSHAAYIQREF